MSVRRRDRALLVIAVLAVVAAAALALARGRGWRSPAAELGAEQGAGAPGAVAVDSRPGRGPTAPPAAGDIAYTVVAGDTLGAVAARFGVAVEDLVAANQLADANSLAIGQRLVIRSSPAEDGPAIRTVPDSELVYGPAYVDFDVAAEIARWGGQLAAHSELVNGEFLTGAEIVDRVSREFSVGPRVLLAFIEARGGWVTGPVVDPERLAYPAGMADPVRSGLWLQLNWLADRLNGGYYDWKTRDSRLLTLRDGTRLSGHPSLGPGSFAVQRALAFQATADELPGLLADVETAYRGLFGDSWAREMPVPDLAKLKYPDLRLPWVKGETWWLTGGPHGGWADGSAWAALDFVPEEDQFGCFTSSMWATAVADGVVLTGGEGQLWLDLDGDGRRQTGPVVLYLHLAAEDRATPGTSVKAGDPLGHPSCEGGMSNATHLHLARLFDGEWLAAAGAVPYNLGGWRATGSQQAYDGGLTHDDGRERTACECRQEGTNDLRW